MIALADYFIRKPLAANMASIIILALGISALIGIERQATPLVELDEVRIISILPTASPQDVELNVTVPIEEALESITDIQKYVSHSSEGQSFITVFIESDAKDKKKVRDQIRRAVDSVRNLPEEMPEKPRVLEVKVEDIVVFEVAAVLEKYDPGRIVEITRKLKKQLMKLEGVARVRESGIPKKEIKIYLNPKSLKKYQMSVEEVLRGIKQNKVRLGGGALESFTHEKGILTISEFENPKDLGQIVLRSTGNGQQVKLKQVTRIAEGYKKQDTLVRYNGKRGGSLLVVKRANADIIDLVDRIQVLKQEFLATSPSDLKLLTTWDFSVKARQRLTIVSQNLAAGFILVLVILFFFLDPLIAFWTAAGIPIAMAGAAAFMPFLGVTINTISLCGMTLVLGMIVDDAIIISESVYRNMEDGLEPKEAALQGLKDVIKPVFGTIVTSIIAFVPLYFLPGVIGQFSSEVPTVVNAMLVASFFEACLILPSHVSHRRKQKSNSKNKKRYVPPGQKLISYLQKIYLRALRTLLKHKYINCILAFSAMTIISVICAKQTNFRMFDLSQSHRVYFMGEVRSGASLGYTERVVKEVQTIIDTLPEGVVEVTKVDIGQEGSFKGARYISHTSFLFQLVLTPFYNRDMTAEEVARKIVEEAKLKLKTQLKTLDFEVDAEGPPVGRPVEIRFNSDDDTERLKLVDEVMNILKDYPVSELGTDRVAGREDLQLVPNFKRLADVGLTVSDVARTIRTTLDGSIVTYQQTKTDRVDVRVQGDPGQINYNNPLAGILVRNQFGNLIPIEGLMNQKNVQPPRKILHYNGTTSSLITANIIPPATALDIKQRLEKDLTPLKEKYPDIEILIGGEARESQKFINNIIFLFIMAVIAIYAWLTIQLEDLFQPFMVVLAIPFGVMGILAAFIAHDYSLSLLALVGVVGVGGVLVNDSLIMVEFINRNQKQRKAKSTDGSHGTPVQILDDIVEGASHRFRPIVLTTITTVIGLMPTAYGLIGDADSFISPLVFAMLWGLMIGTPGVLLVLPMLYATILDLTDKITLIKAKFI